ncbi:hypothetical protein [Novosphingobium sp.]|uniref:hypothetical protein n=1 Tax=Novosphingobium sp. TaxID=1874826 RepID=UPI003D0C2FB7
MTTQLPSQRIASWGAGNIDSAFAYPMSRIRSFRELFASGEGECSALIGALLSASPGSAHAADVAAIAAMMPA